MIPRTPGYKIPKRSPSKTREDRLLAKNRRIAIDNADGLCCCHGVASCTNVATAVHHKLGQGVGGGHEVSNLLPVCHPCHRAIEGNQAWAVENGFTVERRSLGGAA